MSASKRSLLLNIVTASWSKLSGVAIRLLQVPLLLAALGAEDYGRWLLLSSIPAWLSLANFGFGSVASNQISMAAADSDLQRARSVLSTTLLSLLVFGLTLAPIFILIAHCLPWTQIIGAPIERRQDCATAASLLIVSIFFSFSEELFGGRLRAARKTHVAILINSARPWIELLSLMLALHFFKHSFTALAGASLFTTLVSVTWLAIVSGHLVPSIYFSAAEFDKGQVRNIFSKGLAFQAFPLGNALTFQGTLFIVQAALGPAAVAMFATTRTVVRTVSQLIEILNQSTWSEFSHLIGASDMVRAASLHRAAIAISITASTAGAAILLVAGPWLYAAWLGKSLTVSHELFAYFVISLPFNALYTTTSTVHLASNQHTQLAVRYLAATSLSLLLCYVLATHFGLAGAAVSVCLTDALMLPYAISRSIAITHDTKIGFWHRVRCEFLKLNGLILGYLRRRLSVAK